MRNERLIRARGELSQKEFAKEIGVHANTIGRYESGEREPRGKYIAALVERGWNAHWLLTGNGPERLSDLDPLARDALTITLGKPQDPEVGSAWERRWNEIHNLVRIVEENGRLALQAVVNEHGAGVDRELLLRAAHFADAAGVVSRDQASPQRARLIAAIYDILVTPGAPSAAQLIRLVSQAVAAAKQ